MLIKFLLIHVLVRYMVLHSTGRHLTLMVPLSTRCIFGDGEFNAGGNPAMEWHPIQGGVEILLVDT